MKHRKWPFAALVFAWMCFCAPVWAQDAAPSTTPLKDGVKFSAIVTNEWFPLSTVRYAVMEERDGTRMERVVEDETRVIGGVECLVLAEKEYADGALFEISYNFFAQAPDGTVYYFGEDVDDYKDGKVVGHGGAWKVGENAVEPCVFMPGNPTVGLNYNPENSPPVAHEFAQVLKLDGKLKVPAGTFTEVLVIGEQDKKNGPPWKERKYYAKGIGLISENGVLNLKEYKVTPLKAADQEEF